MLYGQTTHPYVSLCLHDVPQTKQNDGAVPQRKGKNVQSESMGLTVAKFGGTSLADAQAIRRSTEVSYRQQGLGIIVVSATKETTDHITHLAQAAQGETWSSAEKIFQTIESRHLQMAEELAVNDQTRLQIQQLLGEAQELARGIYYLKDCSPSVLDSLLSIGERLSSRLVAAVAREFFERPVEWLDVREVLKTDDQFGRAWPILPEIARLCSAKLQDKLCRGTVFVTQGFIGCSQGGQTTTLGRGGSDYSAALLAEAVGADELQIWTDVNGVATTDPRICPSAHTLSELSFVEAAELATFGAKVLHPSTVWPAMRKNIPIFVGTSFDSQQPGTWIRKTTSTSPAIRAIALREQQSILTITTPHMVSAHGFLSHIFQVFTRHKISVDLVSTSEVSVSVTADESTLDNRQLLDELSEIGTIVTENGQGLVSLIGSHINQTPGLAGQILGAISHINIRLLCSGASAHNFCLLMDSQKAREVVQLLHQKFLS